MDFWCIRHQRGCMKWTVWNVNFQERYERVIPCQVQQGAERGNVSCLRVGVTTFTLHMIHDGFKCRFLIIFISSMNVLSIMNKQTYIFHSYFSLKLSSVLFLERTYLFIYPLIIYCSIYSPRHSPSMAKWGAEWHMSHLWRISCGLKHSHWRTMFRLKVTKCWPWEWPLDVSLLWNTQR